MASLRTAQRGKIVSAQEAVRLIRDGDTLATSGFVRIGFAEEIAIAPEAMYLSSDEHCLHADADCDRALSSTSDALPAGPLPGEVMPDLQLGPALHLTDLMQQPAFTLLMLQGDGASVDVDFDVDVDGLPLVQHRLQRDTHNAVAFSALGAATDAAAYLLRPDGHVAARWRRVPSAEVLRLAMARAGVPSRSEAPESA